MTDTRVCYRHSDRPTGVTCQRCERPICPSCMLQASVGFHCPECVRGGGQQKVVRGRAAFGNLSRPPIVTQVLIGINLAVFVAGLIDEARIGTGRTSFIDNFGLFGPCINDREWYRVITGGFLHAGMLHLAFNMFALYNIGPFLERYLGRVKFVLVYFISLVAGSIGALALTPNAVTVGASGAIFGLMAALFLLQRAQGINPWQSGVATTIVLNLLITLAIPLISKGGHIGGLIGGAAAAYLLLELPRRTRNDKAAMALSAALIPALFVVAIGIANARALPAVVCKI